MDVLFFCGALVLRCGLTQPLGFFSSSWPSLAFSWVGCDFCSGLRWYVEAVALRSVSSGQRWVFLAAPRRRRGCLHSSLVVGASVCELAGTVALAVTALAEKLGYTHTPAKTIRPVSKKGRMPLWALSRGRRTRQRQLLEGVPV